MPRIYKPKKDGYKKYNPDVIQKAVHELDACPNATYSDIAEKYNIHKSVLYRHSHKDMKQHGGQCALSQNTEEYVIKNINKLGSLGFPMNLLHIRYIIKLYLDKIGVTHERFKNNLPGPDLVRGLLKRHNNIISNEILEGIKQGKAASTLESIADYDEELIKLIDVPQSIDSKNEENLICSKSINQIIKEMKSKEIKRKRKRCESKLNMFSEQSESQTDIQTRQDRKELQSNKHRHTVNGNCQKKAQQENSLKGQDTKEKKIHVRKFFFKKTIDDRSDCSFTENSTKKYIPKPQQGNVKTLNTAMDKFEFVGNIHRSGNGIVKQFSRKKVCRKPENKNQEKVDLIKISESNSEMNKTTDLDAYSKNFIQVEFVDTSFKKNGVDENTENKKHLQETYLPVVFFEDEFKIEVIPIIQSEENEFDDSIKNEFPIIQDDVPIWIDRVDITKKYVNKTSNKKV